MKRLCEFFPLRDWEQMSGFLREAYRPDLALRHRPIFEWQFMADRYGGNASMICAYEGDALIGIHGYLALPMFWKCGTAYRWGLGNQPLCKTRVSKRAGLGAA